MFLIWCGATVRKVCTSLKLLQNEDLLAKIGFDATENERSKVWHKGSTFYVYPAWGSSLTAQVTAALAVAPEPGFPAAPVSGAARRIVRHTAAVLGPSDLWITAVESPLALVADRAVGWRWAADAPPDPPWRQKLHEAQAERVRGWCARLAAPRAAAARLEREARAEDHRDVPTLVERFDIEPFPDFSAK